MMEAITIGTVDARPRQFVPPLLESLVAAASRGELLLPHVESIVTSFGFDAFEYGVSSTAAPDRDAANHAYTTTPEWTRRYDRMGYIEVDPRIRLTCRSAVPLIWDQASLRGHGAATDAFLDDALAHRIASGVAFMWHGAYGSHMVAGLSSPLRVNSEIRLKSITRNLADIVMFGHYFHEIFVVPALRVSAEPAALAQPLSQRERECLTLAAKGLTTRDISVKLDISSRTVQFHFERIRNKLGAANRHEAIARAVQTGIVRAE